jgi:hypothetical protein
MLHVYGVTRAGAPIGSLTGRQGADVRLVTEAGFSALVSDVDATAAVGRHDLLSHAHVLEKVVAASTVIPMRFGIALENDEDVRQRLLRPEAESLEKMLHRFEGMIQVTVQAFHHEEPALREVVRRKPELVTASAELRRLPEVVARARNVDLGQAIAAGLQELQGSDRQRVLERLKPLAAATVEHEPRAQLEVAHAAFLIERVAADSFGREIAGLGEEVEGWMRFRFVGPQPPYAFLEPVEGDSPPWG